MNQPRQTFTKGERVRDKVNGWLGRVDFLYHLEGEDMVMVEWDNGDLTAKRPEVLERVPPGTTH